MKIGGQNKVGNLTAQNWKTFFKEAGLGALPAARRALALVERVKKVIEEGDTEIMVSTILPDVIRENRIRLNLLR